jgi:SAM-dependent methyltransferase
VAQLKPEEWDAYYARGGGFRPLGPAERRLLAAHVPAPAGGRCLDVGCGTGELARHLAASGYQVDAVDRSAVALTEARRAAGTGVTYRRLDIEHGSLGELSDAAFDLITVRLVWAFVRDRTRVLNRLRERLRPGGALCVITPVADSVPERERGVALDEEEIGLLGAGWESARRYDADGLETSLRADPAGARVRAVLMDSVHGMPRVTAAVRVTRFTGEPVVTEPRLIRRWEWHEVCDLPGLGRPLFTPSAHVLDTVWPGLLPDLPPVHRYPVAAG